LLQQLKFRETYTEGDIQEAVRLVKLEDYSISSASLMINDVKKNPVPRMTLSDRLRRLDSMAPTLGRPQVGYNYIKPVPVGRYQYPYLFFRG